MDEIEKYLNKNFGTIDEPLKEINTQITEADLERATTEYHKLAQEALSNLAKKNDN
ncbi:MAG TPA: hypothetical protein VD884_11135 [Ohtaekwangia sp.]|nr:hypothetical protein [Ohtaekwangia sp.]